MANLNTVLKIFQFTADDPYVISEFLILCTQRKCTKMLPTPLSSKHCCHTVYLVSLVFNTYQEVRVGSVAKLRSCGVAQYPRLHKIIDTDSDDFSELSEDGDSSERSKRQQL